MSSSVRDPWAILELSRGASDNEIKQAYRSLALKFHPDRNPGDKEVVARFQEIAKAYQLIETEDKRNKWLGENEPESLHRRSTPRKKIKKQVEIDFRQAFQGTQLEIDLELEEACSICGGSGAAPGSRPRPCLTCHGRGTHTEASGEVPCGACKGQGYLIGTPCPDCRGGVVRTNRPFIIRIPPGVPNNWLLRLPAPTRGRGQNSEVEIEVRVNPSPIFERSLPDPADLLLDVPLSYREACFGTRIRVPTPDEVVILRIPEGTSSGKAFRLAGKGMPKLGQDISERGDLYARVQIVVPTKMSGAEKRDIEDLQKYEDKNLRSKHFI